MANPHLNLLNAALDNARASYDRTIADAETRLEAARTEHARKIGASESKLAQLESDIQMFDALEQERRARECRTEHAQLYEEHKAIVEGANNALQAAMEHYVKAFSAAALALEASFNSATARARQALSRSSVK